LDSSPFLQAKGVEFEMYDTPTKEPGGIVARTPTGRDAWFKDSEGNLLNLFQRG
jgi:hypothetical protein